MRRQCAVTSGTHPFRHQKEPALWIWPSFLVLYALTFESFSDMVVIACYQQLHCTLRSELSTYTTWQKQRIVIGTSAVTENFHCEVNSGGVYSSQSHNYIGEYLKTCTIFDKLITSFYDGWIHAYYTHSINVSIY